MSIRMSNKKTELSPNLKLWLEKEEDPTVGEGRIELLQAIQSERSINKAAESMDMSYRHAWGIIKKLEERLGYDIVKTIRGGKGGGGTLLTQEGKELIERYDWMNDALKKMVKEKTFWENMSTKVSARNRLKGEIRDVDTGEVGAKIKIKIQPATVTAFITKEATEDLDLKEGDEVEAVIKATEVMVSK